MIILQGTSIINDTKYIDDVLLLKKNKVKSFFGSKGWNTTIPLAKIERFDGYLQVEKIDSSMNPIKISIRKGIIKYGIQIPYKNETIKHSFQKRYYNSKEYIIEKIYSKLKLHPSALLDNNIIIELNSPCEECNIYLVFKNYRPSGGRIRVQDIFYLVQNKEDILWETSEDYIHVMLMCRNIFN